MNVKGLDVSSYNGVINWPSVAKDGYSFALIKAVEGKTLQDPNFTVNVKGARAAGLLVGAYGFGRPATSSAPDEADALLQLIDSVGGVDFPPLLDMEDAGGRYAPYLQAFVQQWMDRIRTKSGKQGVLYTSPAFAKEFLKGSDNIPLWISHYGVPTPTIPNGWTKWTLWQYTGTGKVSGITGPVDLDYFNGTLKDLKNFIGGGNVTTYPKVAAELNGANVDAIAVNNVTYLIWTAAKLTGANLTKVVYGDVEIDGKKGPQVVQGGNTYLEWSSIPTIDAHPVKDVNGVWQFKTVEAPTPQPVQHNYSLVIYENDSAVAGEWVSISIETKDNGQPLGGQTVTFTQNGTNPQSVITDAQSGGYGWGIMETSDTTDTMVFTWKDPAGVLHTVTKTTNFTVPQTTDAAVPADDNVVARIPMLPDSDAANAVFFNMTAPNGQTIKCQLDTGAFELMFTTDAATALALKNEGSLTVQGVGGSASAYYSSADFELNGVKFTGVPCVVEDAFKGYPLFGYRFFIDNGYDLLVSQKHNQIVIMKAQ